MPYVDLAGLSRFAGKSKDFASSACAGLDMANWQKTPEAGAVSFLPVPEMPLDPVVNFLFTESGPASGTKGPDNPSTITGVSSAKVTRCGKNLLAFPYYSSSFTSNGVTFTVASDGSVSTSGTASGDVDFYIASSSNGPWLNSGLSYTLSGCPSGGSTSTYYMRHSAYPTAADTGSGATFTASASGKPAQPIIIRIKSGANVNNLVFKPQLELGSAATAFEPYAGTDYTIDLGGTYYGGSVDLSAGTMTVTHQRLVYDGTEDIRYGNTYYYFMAYSPQIKNRAAFTTTHFVATATGGIVGMAAFMGTSGVRFGWTTEASAAWATEEDLKAWLAAQYAAGTPLTVVYELAEPYTVQLTPQQIYSLSQSYPYAPRVNTVYSDQISVQVGYPKSPQATQNELTNAVVSLGGNL